MFKQYKHAFFYLSWYNGIKKYEDKYMKISAPAKINWAIDILGKREDGYHFVDMIMQQVELYDYITVVENTENEEIKITCNNPKVPIDSSNLCYKAASLYLTIAGIKTGVLINIEKNIPIEAGLAGGSSDGAAVLKALNKIYKALNEEKLLELGAKMGADVPFCINGGSARATNIGEMLKTINVDTVYHLILIKPNFGVSTKKVYNEYDLISKKENSRNSQNVEIMIEKGNANNLASKIGNALEPVTFSLLPELKDIKESVLESGALNAIMSGSGPTIIGLFEDENSAAKAQDILKKRYPDYFIFKTKTIV